MRMPTLPNMVTLVRFIFSPFILPILFVYLLPYNYVPINAVLALVFVLLSLTHFFHGYLARTFAMTSGFGKQIDQVAETCLSYSALVALVAANKIFFYWVIILIGRDFFVTGLQLLAREKGFSLSPSFFDKIMTMMQAVYIAFVVLNPNQSASFTDGWNLCENGLLIITLFLSILTAKWYFNQFNRQSPPPESGEGSPDLFKQSTVVTPEQATDEIATEDNHLFDQS